MFPTFPSLNEPDIGRVNAVFFGQQFQTQCGFSDFNHISRSQLRSSNSFPAHISAPTHSQHPFSARRHRLNNVALRRSRSVTTLNSVMGASLLRIYGRSVLGFDVVEGDHRIVVGAGLRAIGARRRQHQTQQPPRKRCGGRAAVNQKCAG